MSRQVAAYRKLVRSIKTTFKGDSYMQTGALVEVRSKFKGAADVTEQEQVTKLLADAEEAADFLKAFVVQAKLNERGNFAMHVEPHHADASAEEAALRPERS